MNGPAHYSAGEVQLDNALRHFTEHPADMAIAAMAVQIAQAHFAAALVAVAALELKRWSGDEGNEDRAWAKVTAS